MKAKTTISFLFAALFLFGCSKHEELSRDTAEKLIKDKYQFPTNEIISLRIWDETNPNQETKDLFERLQNEGFLTYDSYRAVFTTVYSATLTEKGNQYAVSDVHQGEVWGIKNIDVIGAKIKFGQITGILEQNESNTAEVRYQVIREVNRFGRIIANFNIRHRIDYMNFNFNDGAINKQVIFKKYDDGWRIE